MNELPITGYLDRLSARPGECLEVRVSAQLAGRCHARLVRVRGADPNPAGPGLELDDLSALFARDFEGRRQTIVTGSWAQSAAPPLELAPTTWTALAMPTIDWTRPRPVLQHHSERAELTLLVGAQEVQARLVWAEGEAVARVGAKLRRNRWHRVWASIDPAAGTLLVGVHTPLQLYEPASEAFAAVTGLPAILPTGGTLYVARASDATQATFTGKLEDPAVLAGFHHTWPEPLVPLAQLDEGLLAGWDFSHGIGTPRCPGLGRHPAPAELHNTPMRAVVGARWSGREHCWRHAPGDYGAVRFHEDDLGGCGWQTDVSLPLPDDLASGPYAVHLSCPGGEDIVPFFVLPPRTGSGAKVAFLAPTFTYQAYANFALGWTTDAWRERVAQWHAYPHSPDDFPIYGRSTYNLHSDGSGIAYSSIHRPILNLRPGFVTFVDKAGSGVRHYASDSHLWGWLEASGIDYDIVTDHDLDEEGPALLERYRVVLTGGHPEYHTSGTLDALQQFVRSGGGLCYLGGNGFYWRVARSPDDPGTIEVRRAENGVRAWAAEPGEYHHAFDGQLGGLWKRNRRDPQQVAVTGFTSQGRFEATHYRRTAESYDPAVAWIFEGVESDRFGDHGLNSGGAAGYELDRADPELGTPDGAVVVARAEDLQPGFAPLMEDMIFPPTAFGGGPASALVRSDMTFFSGPGGGGVFAVSSISFCGSLWHEGRFGGDTSTILGNVVRHFLR